MEQNLIVSSGVNLEEIAGQILETRRQIPAWRSVLVAITGIDGCGKGYLTARLGKVLAAAGVHIGVIGIDGWLNLPYKRFSDRNPAKHFYLYGIRFDEMFAQLIFPLRDRRLIRLEADFTEETTIAHRKHVYEFENLDIILLEGIFLLKRTFQHYYDLSVWIDCTFETALERAINRSQEGLPPKETIQAYRTIYFPAQQIHFKRDNPKRAATFIINNDSRLDSFVEQV